MRNSWFKKSRNRDDIGDTVSKTAKSPQRTTYLPRVCVNNNSKHSIVK